MSALRRGIAIAAVSALIAASSRDAHADEHRLHWDYPEFRKEEVYAAAAVSWADLTIEYVIQTHPKRHIDPIPWFDEPIRDTLRPTNAETRLQYSRWSNTLWHVTQWAPVVIDGLFLPLVTDKWNTKVAVQITALNWQAETMAFFFMRLAHRTVGRERPMIRACPEDPSYDPACQPGASPEITNVSFVGGHSTMSFAGAGLICAHHANLPLLGGGAADVGICAIAMTSATAVSLMRIVGDHHWPSDVLAGAAIGLGTGLGLPYALHYHTRLLTPSTSGSLTWLVTLAPVADGLGLMTLGTF
jgi:membrane-associated phospholipid phosphatase